LGPDDTAYRFKAISAAGTGKAITFVIEDEHLMGGETPVIAVVVDQPDNGFGQG
jgi:hypothetical protein